MRKIVLTGGGTGGHVIPCLALLPTLKEYFAEIVFIGGNGMEKEMAEAEGIPFFGVETVKFDRETLINNVKIPYKLWRGTVQAKKLLREIAPDVVFAKGGYVSLPTALAAKELSIPVVCHESDYTMGLANKWISHFAAKTLTSFPETEGGVYVGNPVRKEVLQGSKIAALRTFPVDVDRKTVLICGGSQGAKVINETVYELLPRLTEKYNVIHVAGKCGNFAVRDTKYYTQLTYARSFPDLLHLCDLIVTRGGANTLFECASTGKMSVCIPLPKGSSRGDQVLNAESFRKKGYTDILLQEDMTPETLWEKIEKNVGKTFTPLPCAEINENIVKEIRSCIKK